MPSPLLTNIAAPQEELAVDAILLSLRDDPLILQNAIQVQGPEGDRQTLPVLSQNRPNVPNPNEPGVLPLIRLFLGNYQSRWDTEGTHKGDLELRFELYAPGSHYGDRFRLWSVFLGAIFPQDPARRQIVKGRTGSYITGEKLALSGSDTLYTASDQAVQLTKAVYVITFDILT
jgi:hypothetical protein